MNRVLRKPLALLWLALTFARALVQSGWQTLLLIARASAPGAAAPASGLVRLPYAPMSETGAALLGCLITLTPGTTTLHVDTQRHELLLHVLDTSDLPGMAAGVREDFERHLVALFGTARGPA